MFFGVTNVEKVQVNTVEVGSAMNIFLINLSRIFTI